MTIDPQKIAFRKLQLNDLALMYDWLNSPHVNRWYKRSPYTCQDICRKYEPRIRGEAPTRTFLILYGGDPIGYIQTYRISDHPHYNTHVGADEHTAGVDLFIGEVDYLHKGFGTAALRRFLEEEIFCDESFSTCLVGPEPANRAAIRCYEKVGFRYWKTVQFAGDAKDEFLMRISREDLL